MKPFIPKGSPSSSVHSEREKVFTRLVAGSHAFGGAVFSRRECQVLKEIMDELALEATAANMRPEQPGERNNLPTLCGGCGNFNCRGACKVTPQ